MATFQIVVKHKGKESVVFEGDRKRALAKLKHLRDSTRDRGRGSVSADRYKMVEIADIP